MDDLTILVINPWSTSTKISVFNGKEEVFKENIQHSSEELKEFKSVTEQFPFRRDIIIKKLSDSWYEIAEFDAIVWRWGLLKPIPSGVYEVNGSMIEDLLSPKTKQHASNLWALIANDLAKKSEHAKAFIADPVVVDELSDIARVSWHPKFKRVSIFHALNQKAIWRQFAEEQWKKYEDLNLIIVHMWWGVSIWAHKKWKVVDVNQALWWEWPFSPERSWTLPVDDVIRMCYSWEYTEQEMMKLVNGHWWMVWFLWTNNAYEAELKALAWDEKHKFIIEAFCYQVAKYIWSMMTVLEWDVDAILLTGWIAKSKRICEQITKRVEKIAPVYYYPGEDEMRALANNGLNALLWNFPINEY